LSSKFEAYEKMGRYVLGTKRTLEQYVDFCGVDTINRKSSSGDSHCIVYYVDWDDSDVKAEYEKKKAEKNKPKSLRGGVEPILEKLAKLKESGSKSKFFFFF
jgi:hypothetical protein